MNKTKATKRSLYWIPRVLCVLFALFLSLFALDVFTEGQGFGDTIVALLVHLIPTCLVIIALVVAWRWEGVGGSLFIFFAILFMAISRGEGWIISGPLFLLGILFLFNWFYRKQHNRGSSS